MAMTWLEHSAKYAPSLSFECDPSQRTRHSYAKIKELDGSNRKVKDILVERMEKIV